MSTTKRSPKKTPSDRRRTAGKAQPKRASTMVSFLQVAPPAPADDFVVEGLANLRRIQSTLQLRAAEAAKMFGVTRQAFTEWLKRGVPGAKAAKVDRVALVVAELAKRFRPQQVPRISRASLPILDGRSIVDTLRTEGAAPIHEMFRRWDAYVPGSAPIRAGECRDT